VLARPAFAADFYVDPVAGDDTRSSLLAQSPSTPWRTIAKALSQVQAGHRIVALPGQYAESLQTSHADVVLKASAPGTAVIQPAAGASGLQIDHPGLVVEGLVFQGGAHGVKAVAADDLTIRNCVVVGTASDGISVLDTTSVLIEGTRAISSGGAGILLERTGGAYLRSNLIYDSDGWGVEIDNSNPSDPQPPVAAGNVLAFNTIAFNGGTSGGGARFHNATGEVRDNVFASNAPFGLKLELDGVSVHHDLFFQNTTAVDPADYPLGSGILTSNPRFVSPGGANGTTGGIGTWVDDDFSLSQTAAGQAQQSPAVDAGSGAVASRDIAGSTRSDDVADAGTADMGFHEGSGVSAGAPAIETFAGEYHVDCAAGDDARPKVVAQTASTPWRTIRRALSSLTPGDTLTVAAGTCTEIGTVEVEDPDVTVQATAPGTVIVQVPAGQTGFSLEASGVVLDGFVVESTFQGVLAAHPAAGTVLEDLVLRDLTVRPSGASMSQNAVQVRDARAVTVENCVVSGSLQRGILLKRVSRAYVRNNLVYGNPNEWGIDFDNSNGGVVPLSQENVAAFNTVYGNQSGLRFNNTEGEIRDNVIAGNTSIGLRVTTEGAGSHVHHNDSFGNSPNYSMPAGFVLGSSNLAVDPLFVAVGSGDFSLSQTAAGQAVNSPLVDAGSDLVADADISGSTRSDGVADAAGADPGYHAEAAPSASPPGGDGGQPPPGSLGADYYVDCASGNDARQEGDAQIPTSPWRTIRRALQSVSPGDTVNVAPGTCVETAGIEISTEDVTVRAITPGSVTVSAPTGTTTFEAEASGVVLEGFVIETDFQGVLAAHSNSGTIIEDVVLRSLVVRPFPAGSISQNAVQVRDVDSVTVENCTITGSLGRGLLLKRVTHGYARNNLVYGHPNEWGIDFDNTADGSVPLSQGNVAAFNTVYGNLRGLRFNNSSGEIRDNVVVLNGQAGIRISDEGAGSYVHHNDSFGNAPNYDLPFTAENSNLSVDPLFVAPGAGNFALAQTAAGQASDSPALNRGSNVVASADISGSTRTDAVADDGVADLGYHAGATDSPSPPGGPGPMPPPALATVYVNCATGDDTRSKVQAQLSWTPWKTLAHAITNLLPDETMIVQAGTCAERLVIPATKAGVHVRADVAGATTIAPSPDLPAVEIAADRVKVSGFVIQSTDEGVRAAKTSISETISDVVLRDLRVEMTTAASGALRSKNGIFFRNGVRPVIENSIVLDADESGIRLNQRTLGTDAYVHNNLVTGAGEWGIFLTPDLTGAPVTGGHVVAFNTVVMNGTTGGQGGIFLEKASGEVRDNIVTNNSGRGIKVTAAGVRIHHNNVFGQPTAFDTVAGTSSWANLSVDPGFVDQVNYRLQHVATGHPSDSAMIGAGSGTPAAVDISGSTRSDGVADAGIADLGFHTGAGASTGVPTPAPIPTPTPTPSGPPEPGSGDTLYVDPAAGDNAASREAAMSPSTPWRTVQYALAQASPGDVIRLLPGVYSGQGDVNDDAVTLVGHGPLGSVVLEPPAGEAGVVVEGLVDARIENLVVRGGAQGVLAIAADGIHVTGVAVVSPSSVGIQIRDTETAWVDSCIVTGAGTDGILLRRTSGAYVRNNLVYVNGEWGISLDNEDSPSPPVSIGNVVAFNTVHRNQDGIRFLNASGEVRDNQITEQTDLGLYLAGPNLFAHHNNFSANGRDRDRESEFASSIFVWSILGKNPRYVEPDGADGVLGGSGWEDDRFELSQLDAGDDFDSPSVDAGSAEVGTRDISGTTRTDAAADSGAADVGFHYGASPAAGPPPVQPAGQLVFTYYVNGATGDDTRTDATARNSATPWRTITHALQRVEAGAIISVADGDYIEAVQVQKADVNLVAETAGKAVIRAPASSGANAVTVEAPGVSIDGFVLRSGMTGVSALAGSDDLEIRNCTAVGTASDGFRVVDSTGVVVEDSRAIGSAFSGILLRRVDDATIRNNLLYDNGEWGLAIDNSPIGSQVLPVSAGNLVAENTIAFNELGNLRLANAVGEIRDNLLTDTPGVGMRTDTDGSLLLHNGFARATTLLDPDDAIICAGCAGNRFAEPRYIAPAGADGIRGGSGFLDDDFRLAQFAAGQSEQSEGVDAGSDDAPALGATGTTSTSGSPDTSAIDLGFHYGATERSAAPPKAPLPEGNLHVDASTGDDARTRVQAGSPATPWRTIARALADATPGDVILIAPGVYPERVRIETSDLTLRGTGSSTGTRLAPGNRTDAVQVRAVGVTLENLWIEAARRGIYGSGTLDGLTVKDVAISGTRREGISVRRSVGVTLDGVTVAGAGAAGIRTSRVTDLELRDCTVYASRTAGVAILGGDATASFLTLFANGREGLRTSRTDLTLRDSIVAGNGTHGLRLRGESPVAVSYVHFHDNPEDVAPATAPLGAGVAFGLDPLLVDPDGADGVLGGAGWLDDDLSLSQIAGGQAVNSPAVDAGSDLASNLGVSGSTASNAAPDLGQADLGAHR
jgi:hypothetical protein